VAPVLRARPRATAGRKPLVLCGGEEWGRYGFPGTADGSGSTRGSG